MNPTIKGDFAQRDGIDEEMISSLLKSLVDWAQDTTQATRTELFTALVTVGLMCIDPEESDEEQDFTREALNEMYLTRFFTDEELEDMKPMIEASGEPN